MSANTRTHTQQGGAAPTQSLRNGLAINRGQSVYFIGGRRSIAGYFEKNPNGLIATQRNTGLSITFDRIGGHGHGIKERAKGVSLKPFAIGQVLTNTNYRRRHGIFGTISRTNTAMGNITKLKRATYTVVQVAASAVNDLDHEVVIRNISSWVRPKQILDLLGGHLGNARTLEQDGTETTANF